MTNLIRNIVKFVFAFCVIVALLLTMYGVIILMAMNYIAWAIIVLIIIACIAYVYLEFSDDWTWGGDVEAITNPTFRNVDNIPDEYLQAIKKILQRGCYEGIRYEGIGEEIYIAEASIKKALEYYESVRQ
jgi:hypothetical protein